MRSHGDYHTRFYMTHNIVTILSQIRVNTASFVLTHEHLKVPEIDVWIDDTFDNNFLVKNNFTEYLKKSCG